MPQRSFRLSWSALVLLFILGCGPKGYQAYVPSEDLARKALEATLTAWQDGQKPGKIESSTPPVQVIDSRWLKGDKLASFQILQEDPTKEGPKIFQVKLTMKTPPGEKTVRYYVVGRDPLWIYRDDDYKQSTGM